MYCFVLGCPNSGGAVKDPRKARMVQIFFNAPQDETLFKKWQEAIPKSGRIFSRSDKLCDFHFKKSEVVLFNETKLPNGNVKRVPASEPKLKAGTVPSIFPATKEAKSTAKRKAAADSPRLTPKQKESIREKEKENSLKLSGKKRKIDPASEEFLAGEEEDFINYEDLDEASGEMSDASNPSIRVVSLQALPSTSTGVKGSVKRLGPAPKSILEKRKKVGHDNLPESDIKKKVRVGEEMFDEEMDSAENSNASTKCEPRITEVISLSGMDEASKSGVFPITQDNEIELEMAKMLGEECSSLKKPLKQSSAEGESNQTSENQLNMESDVREIVDDEVKKEPSENEISEVTEGSEKCLMSENADALLVKPANSAAQDRSEELAKELDSLKDMLSEGNEPSSPPAQEVKDSSEVANDDREVAKGDQNIPEEEISGKISIPDRLLTERPSGSDDEKKDESSGPPTPLLELSSDSEDPTWDPTAEVSDANDSDPDSPNDEPNSKPRMLYKKNVSPRKISSEKDDPRVSLPKAIVPPSVSKILTQDTLQQILKTLKLPLDSPVTVSIADPTEEGKKSASLLSKRSQAVNNSIAKHEIALENSARSQKLLGIKMFEGLGKIKKVFNFSTFLTDVEDELQFKKFCLILRECLRDVCESKNAVTNIGKLTLKVSPKIKKTVLPIPDLAPLGMKKSSQSRYVFTGKETRAELPSEAEMFECMTVDSNVENHYESEPSGEAAVIEEEI